MTNPIKTSEEAVDTAITSLSKESDRGAAVLAGSLLENALGAYLARYCAQHAGNRIIDKLFGANGPISTFSQRTLVARAFGLIDQPTLEQIDVIRKVRNHFAHHPLEASFEDSAVQALVRKLPIHTFAAVDQTLSTMGSHRMAYLIACARYTAYFEFTPIAGIADKHSE